MRGIVWGRKKCGNLGIYMSLGRCRHISTGFFPIPESIAMEHMDCTKQIQGSINYFNSSSNSVVL